MQGRGRPQAFPRGALLGAGALVAFTLAAAAAPRFLDRPIAEPPGAAVESRDLFFEDRADGSVAVLAAKGVEVASLQPGTNGFARSLLRGLARERMKRGAGPETPFTLTRRADGRLDLADPVTGRRVELVAFGPTNAAVFARLLYEGDRR